MLNFPVTFLWIISISFRCDFVIPPRSTVRLPFLKDSAIQVYQQICWKSNHKTVSVQFLLHHSPKQSKIINKKIFSEDALTCYIKKVTIIIEYSGIIISTLLHPPNLSAKANYMLPLTPM